MTTMKVTLEDERSIEVPARRHEMKSRQISAQPRPSVYILKPLPHPDYDFIAIIAGLRAEPKDH